MRAACREACAGKIPCDLFRTRLTSARKFRWWSHQFKLVLCDFSGSQALEGKMSLANVHYLCMSGGNLEQKGSFAALWGLWPAKK